ncbi:MAG: MarR family transcriptional regulator [Coriobacteriales bacterium]|jgi:DNA-binding MarR family transcriptional regulator|nr:MarR family transcriptional regulator [Coriobacteriales bacterium]
MQQARELKKKREQGIEAEIMAQTLEEILNSVYLKFKLQFYKRVFQRLQSREATLSTSETFCVEAIDALGTPTVSEFAKFLNISVANATYKVQNLEKKGYLRKERSEEDRRESYLFLTDRFFEYKNLHTSYTNTVIQRVSKTCSPEEISIFKHVLEIINDELTPEVELQKK